jgi:RNA polymerase sigma-70 factor (ECF subfamily)
MPPAGSDGGSDFFEQNYDRVYRYVRGMVRDPDEAEDLTQDAFLRAHRERDTLKDPEAMLSWLYCIATHASLDRLRRRKTREARQSDVDPAGLDPPDLEEPALDQRLAQGQMSACVQRFVVGLPDTYRSVLLLHDTHGLSAPEIAAALEVSLPTVKIRLHRARRRLKAALEEGCELSCDSRGVLVCEPKK